MSEDRFGSLIGKYVLIQTTVPWFAVVRQQRRPIMVFEEAAQGGAMPRPFPFVRGTVRSTNATDIVLETTDLGDDSGVSRMVVTVPIQYIAFINEAEAPSTIIFSKSS